MDKNEYIIRLSQATSDLWTVCNETMSRIDKNLVTHGIDDMILNLKEYIGHEKDKALGCLCKYEALSGSIGLSEDDVRKIVSLKESISSISDDCRNIEEYVINACTLASISERLVSWHMEYREKVMASVDASKFILIARDRMGGTIPEKDPFSKAKAAMITNTAKSGIQASAPLYAKNGANIAAQGLVGIKASKGIVKAARKALQIKSAVKNVVNKVKEIMGTFLKTAGKAAKVTGKSINKAGKGTEIAGDMTNTAGDIVNTAAEASAAIPVADLVTVPTGLAAGTTVKGAGAVGKGIGKLEEMSGQTIESGGKIAENAGNSLRSAGSTVTKGATDVASKVCRAMTRSGNIIVRTNGKVLSSMIKATGKTSNVASLSLSRMYEGISKGVKCNEEKELIR